MTEARRRSVSPDVDQQVGKNIHMLRRRLDWTAQELSYRIRETTGEDISVAVLRVIEGDGKRNRRISIGEAQAVAQTFGVSLDALVKEMR